MDVCLSHPEHGYYMNKETAKIGKAGDFVTAPEISQMFGELLGVWGVATWEKLGTPRAFRLAEIGPGKGTLMQDVLRVARTFAPFHKGLAGVHMVETSKALRKVQAEALGAIQAGEKKEEGKKADSDKATLKGDVGEKVEWERGGRQLTRKPSWRLPCERGIDWHEDIRQVPVGSPLIIFAQELLDALPVHQFEYTAEGWRERLVDVEEDPLAPHHFKFTLAKGPTPPVVHLESLMPEKLQALLDGAAAAPPARAQGGAGEDKDDKNEGEKKKEEEEKEAIDDDPEKRKLGTSLEVCPLALQIVQQVAERVARTGGAALFVDYGEDHAQGDSLRGLKRHALVHALSEPGEVDLSTDVDFAAIKEAVAGVEGVRAFGPMPQGEFLSAMGIETRLQALLDGKEGGGLTDKQALLLYDSYRRLVDPEQMGRKYKVLALVSSKHQGPAIAFPSASMAKEKVTEKEEENEVEEERK
jgi:NADH dehydrogenase [ubiquinone] 1 alpha subcomplex assembly factor 7